MRVFVTGASGFVGQAVCRTLLAAGHEVSAGFCTGMLPLPVRRVPIGRIDGRTSWQSALAGVDMVCHLASPAHRADQGSEHARAEFRAVIVDGGRRLTEAAIEAGVRRIVFVSTIKVNGESTAGRPFSEQDAPAPEDDYGRCKLEAEHDLMREHQAGRIEAVVLRPPLVCGANAKGNLFRLLQLCDLGLPLPFGSISNRRSFVGVDNLADAVRACLEQPQAAGHRFLVSDHPPRSTTELVRLLCDGLGRPARLFPVPAGLALAAGRLAGRGDTVQRLFGSLEVDGSLIRRTLGWQPPVAPDRYLTDMAQSYRMRRRGDPARRFLGSAWPAAAEQDGISVVMVTYHTGPVLHDATRRVLASKLVRELIIADNGNDRASSAYLDRLSEDPRVTLLRGQGNVGYARGCNIAAQCASGRYLLILNPDCLLEPDTLDRLIAVLDRQPGGWVATPSLVNTDGSLQKGCRRELSTPAQWLAEVFGLQQFRSRRTAPKQRDHAASSAPGSDLQAVPAISGAFMLMPRQVYVAMGGLDPAYFIHFEDLDFCMRLRERGIPAYFVEDIRCVHVKGTSKVTDLYLARHKARSMRIYFRRYFARGPMKAAAGAVWLFLSAGLFLSAAVSDLSARQRR